MIITKGMYDKEFKIDNNGKEETILLKPLPLSNIPNLFKIMNEIQKHTIDKQVDVLGVLSSDKDTTLLIMDVIKATVKKSYPELEDNLVDEFVAVNMFQLLPLVIEVNFRQ